MDKSPDAFRTISEVADWLQTPAHVLRFWESKFAQVKPVKRAGGRRYYRPADMMLLGGIKKLLHDDGMTIKGVQKILREQGVRHVARLSARQLDAEGAEFEEAAEIADAPFVEVEAAEPEERLIAFPNSAARPPTPKPDLPPDPPPTPEPDLPDGPGDIDAAADFDDAAVSDETAAEVSWDAETGLGLEDSADVEPPAESVDLASDPVRTPGDTAKVDVADADAQDEPGVDSPAPDFDSAGSRHVAAQDEDRASVIFADEDTDESPEDAGAPGETQLSDADTEDMHDTLELAARQGTSETSATRERANALEATLPQPVPQATKPGPIGRLAWLETLSDEQSEAVRAALPALRALHERLAATTVGER
ncbi:MerR family transcriptional regulator [Citreimonas salinaria]|uniref:MerR HTH family regulatory protein n=1 Tax=Citreimonas salinaria TaxID=321339 RepID=A0A1H3KR82_9RHOB|nr:MerR family transcriptional regulator [Citreimonas salinaria]SDY54174.1 MerR HTH family regulatory protein [Citreimonas salinaria]